jgi:hypothetical protein
LNFRHDDPAHPNATSKDYSLWNGRFGFPWLALLRRFPTQLLIS